MAKFGGFLENPIGHDLLAKTVLEMEKLGFDSVWLEDHLVISPGLPDDYLKVHKEIPISILAPSQLECWTTLAWLTAQTRKVRLGTLVTCNLFRYPSVLAKMSATLDVLSNGRLELGLGAGYWKPEFERYGIPLPGFDARMERLAEAVQLIKGMWTEEVSNFQGKYYVVKGALNNPKPIQKPHPPILLGGSGERLMKVAAQFADNWNFPVTPTLTPSEYHPYAAKFDEYCRQAGRSPGDVVKSMIMRCIIDKNPEGVREKVKRLKPDWEPMDTYMRRLIGTPQQCIEKLNGFVGAGIGYFILHFEDANDFESMKLFAQEVIPAVK